MKKYILGLVMVLVFVSNYSYVSAVGDIDPNTDTNECISLVNNLRYRDRDANKNGEVSTLQDFLQAKGYLNTEPTGYFGLLTFKAVKDFQNANNITPVSGYVGPLTRAKIKNISCGETLKTESVKVTILREGSGNAAQSGDTLYVNYTGRLLDGTVFDSNVDSKFNHVEPFIFTLGKGQVIKGWEAGITGMRVGEKRKLEIAPDYAYGSSGNGLIPANATLIFEVELLQIKDKNISTPSIKVLSPNGGETYKVGQQITVKWEITGFSKNVNRADVYLKSSNGGWCYFGEVPLSTMSYTIVLDNCNSGGVRNTFSGQYKATVILYDYYGLKPEPGTAFAGNYSDSNFIDSSDNYFTITSSTTTGPTISGISGPQTLNVGQQGTWIVNAYDNSIPGSSGNLSYSVVWGDACLPGASCSSIPTAPLQHSATFTHTYSTAGNYTPTFYVTNGNGKTSQTSLSVMVGSEILNNHYPALSPFVVPTGMSAGKVYNFSFSATDEDNDNLSWNIDWGDYDNTGSTTGGCPVTSGRTWGFNTNHTWKTVGTYNVKVIVSDCRGGTASKIFPVTIINSSNTTSVPAPTISIIPRNPGGVIPYNSSAWINWMSYNSTSCTLSADNQLITTTFFSSANPTFTYGNAGGSKEVGPLTKSTIYSIKCEGPGGIITKQETIEVEPAPIFCVNGKTEQVKNNEGKIISYSCINENMPSWYGFSRASFFDSEVTNSSSISFQNYMLLEGDDVVAGETIYILAYNQNDRNIKIYSNSSSQPIQEISLDYYKNGKYIAAYQIPERVGEKIYFTSNNKKSTVLNIISKVSDTDKVRLGLLWRTKQGNVVETVKKSSGGVYLSSRAPYSGTWRVYKKDTNELVKEFSDSEIISGGPSHNRSHPYTTFEYTSRALFNPPSSGEYYFTIETGIKGVTTTYNVYRSSNLIVSAD